MDSKRCPQCGRSFASIRCQACGFTGEEEAFSQGCPVCGYTAPAPRKKQELSAKPLPFWIYILAILALIGAGLGLLLTLR